MEQQQQKTEIQQTDGESAVQQDTFVWSELPAIPAFYKAPGETADKDEDEDGQMGRHLSKRVKRIAGRILLYLLEACVLIATITSILLWRENDVVPPQNAENIVYSSDSIVMMLMKTRQQWILSKPGSGNNACCFLDMDFDGTPELISISYDSERILTKVRVFRIRNCQLDEIACSEQLQTENNGFYDISRSLSLYYSTKTNEMLYFSQNIHLLDLAKTETDTGCFFLQENQISDRKYFQDTYDIGIRQYYFYDEDNALQQTTQLDFQRRESALFNSMVNLHLNVEWIASNEGLERLSDHKLAALLLRSYDAFSYDDISSQRQS